MNVFVIDIETAPDAAVVPLDEIASLLGYLGRLGMTGADLWAKSSLGMQ